MDNNYINELLDMFNNNSSNLSQETIINIYLTLITLSNCQYNESFYITEAEKIENFLRKVNNLKVKIQLGRKITEIDALLAEIKELYNTESDLISRYNKENIDIFTSLDTKEPIEITKVVDNLTKEKLRIQNNKEKYDELRNIIFNNIFKDNYYINDNKIYIELSDNPDFNIELSEFYEIFSYLLNIDNYKQPFIDNKANRLHTIMIANLIKALVNKEINDKSLIIPISLTYITSKNKEITNEFDASKFKIDNIKITDLYNLANIDNKTNPNMCSRWQKIIIPNEYLYMRIRNNSLKGMYYLNDDYFITEDIKDNSSDFKISINKSDMYELLINILNNLKNETVYAK